MSEEMKSDKSRPRKAEAPSRSGESKRDRFKRLAETRVPRATWALQSIGKLANRYNYEFDETDAQKIIRHLQNELDDLKRRFTKGTSNPGKFSLD